MYATIAYQKLAYLCIYACKCLALTLHENMQNLRYKKSKKFEYIVQASTKFAYIYAHIYFCCRSAVKYKNTFSKQKVPAVLKKRAWIIVNVHTQQKRKQFYCVYSCQVSVNFFPETGFPSSVRCDWLIARGDAVSGSRLAGWPDWASFRALDDF
jgi:hypothetical protein